MRQVEVSILYLRCRHAVYCARDVNIVSSFNSLFEMQCFDECMDVWKHSVYSFNSLFEMLVVGRDRDPGGPARFNSLFEMRDGASVATHRHVVEFQFSI